MRIKKPRPELPELNKGTLLAIKAPPYFNKEYFYEVTSAGEKLIRASLFHSPTVRKSWSREELRVQFEHGVVRLATESEAAGLQQSSRTQEQQSEGED